MKKRDDLKQHLDEYLYTQLKSETPAYLTMLRERLADLCDRGIEASEAPAYLASAGWSKNIAKYYKELIKFANEKDDREMAAKGTNTSNGDSGNTFSPDQMKTLLELLLIELADAAGFRKRQEAETLVEYREAFKTFLLGGVQVDMEVASLQEEQLTQCIEVLKAQAAHYRYLLGKGHNE